MTGMPEASLARELELCMALVCVVTNHAAGLTGKHLTASEVVDTMNRGMDVLRTLLQETVALTPSARVCLCGEALKEAEL
jgi:5'-methylthioadenosine phosphorylase